MKHSRYETFFWLEAASLLDRVGEPSLTADEDPELVLDFTRVRQSLDLASWIFACLAQRQVSINELANGANKASEMRVGPLRVNVKKYALAHVGATGNIADRVVAYALKRGIITKTDVLRARRKRKRHPSFEAERISAIAHFLINYWCGERGAYGQSRQLGIFFMPPLCFFTDKALADFCEVCLGVTTNSGVIRQWIHRLRLVRPKHPPTPKIKDVKLHKDGIHFCP